MARSKRSTKGSAKETIASTSGNGDAVSAADLLAKAEAILTDTGDAGLAVKFAERAAANSQELSQEEQIKLSELLGLCALENEDDDKAKAVSRRFAAGLQSIRDQKLIDLFDHAVLSVLRSALRSFALIPCATRRLTRRSACQLQKRRRDSVKQARFINTFRATWQGEGLECTREGKPRSNYSGPRGNDRALSDRSLVCTCAT